MSALDYFLKANLYGLLFVSCYWLFLRRHTFFSLNRSYLLASAVLSLILPLASLPAQTVETLPENWSVPVGVIALPTQPVALASTEIIQSNSAFDWEQAGLVAYGLIALVLVLQLAARVGRLLWQIRRLPQQAQDSYILVDGMNQGGAESAAPTFSFFRYLVLSPADRQNELIIRHELVHIRQYHSADVLGLALLRAVFWACPALWFIDRMLRQVHEFLADQDASQPTEYARFLVAYTFGLQPDTLTNGFFNPSLLKLRIQMLHQRTTKRWALGKYVLVLPLALSLLAMTTARENIATVVDQITDNTITVSGRVTRSVDGKPLQGANVVIKGTNKGTSTDSEGRYTLNGLLTDQSLVVSFIGYETQFVPLSGRQKINVSLVLTAPNELPTMGATSVYKAIKPNPAMPVRTPPSSETINGEVFTTVEEPAVFPTGIPGLMQYVAHALRYPAKAKATGVEGNVLVQFVVLPTGTIGSASVKKGIGSGCDEEALRVVKQMPRWLPGKQNGKAVATQYVLPIQFSLEKKTDDKRTGRVTPTSRPNSTSVAQTDSSEKRVVRLRAFRAPQIQQFSQMRYSAPIRGNFTIQSPTRGLPGEKAELYLLNGTKQIDRVEDINPNDIESIEVDKNPQTIAKYKTLYGEKASKGVVTIHLKSANAL